MLLSVSNTDSPPLCILKENEAQIVAEVQAYLEARYPEEAKVVKERFQCLKGLGDAISQYPSVRSIQIMRGKHRGEENLVEALSSFSSASHLFHIPTRVVATRSFMVAKFHAFSMLSMLVRDIPIFYLPLRRLMLAIVCTIMVEEVYFSCLEDLSFDKEAKVSLANDLISLWDSGRDPRSIRHLPALESLWVARDAAPPTFGTMEGSSELIRISMDMGKDWHGFLVQATEYRETRWALEEFLFGLSYEEILKVRSRLARFGLSAVGRDEVRSYIGSQPAYRTVKDSDPRTIYDFYIDRREAALFRRRIDLPGPQQTLEEIYLKYLITTE
jgi:hypothetical protein